MAQRFSSSWGEANITRSLSGVRLTSGGERVNVLGEGVFVVVLV